MLIAIFTEDKILAIILSVYCIHLILLYFILYTFILSHSNSRFIIITLLPDLTDTIMAFFTSNNNYLTYIMTVTYQGQVIAVLLNL